MDDYAVIYLKLKSGEQYETYVDLDDLERLLKFGYHWHLSWNTKGKCYYCKCTIRVADIEEYKRSTLYLHSYIMNHNQQIDHISHNTLDNRKKNLRVLTKNENNLYRKGANCNNKTGHRNVSYIERDEEYLVQFSINYERFVWKFKSNEFEEACEFADKKRLELYGVE